MATADDSIRIPFTQPLSFGEVLELNARVQRDGGLNSVCGN